MVSAGCSSDDGSATPSSPSTTETAASTVDSEAAPELTSAVTIASTTTAVPATTPPTTFPDTDEAIPGYRKIVETLASDAMAGRDTGSPGSAAAQDFLFAQLAEFTQPLVTGPTGRDAFRQTFDVGTNLLGLIPGHDLSDQYVIVGAHYDHLGSDCRDSGPADNICNGATDNATGVAVALAVGRLIANTVGDKAPRRSVIIALWDAEEDGLLGSAAYVANPAVPLSQTVAYVNFDIQGTNISPSLRDLTLLIGAETGGPNLVKSADVGANASTLDTVRLSLLFGQGRSDHATFVDAHVPAVFFTDATPPCFHTVGDDASIVDYPKLEQQVAAANQMVRTLANANDAPVFDPNTPAATYGDAVSSRNLLLRAQADFSRFSDLDRVVSDQFVADVGAIVDAGPDAFDDGDVDRLFAGSLGIVQQWSAGECDGFLDNSS